MRVYYGVAEAGLFKGNIDAPPSNMHVYPEFDSWKKRHDIGSYYPEIFRFSLQLFIFFHDNYQNYNFVSLSP